MTESVRSSLSITLSVWRALFLREALGRITGGRAPWMWLVLEPLAHMAFLATMMVVIRHRVMGGMDVVIWIVVGLLTFFVFRRTGQQGLEAIHANRSLFAYRQVRPVDTILVRAALETFVMLIIAAFVLAALALMGYPVMADDPLLVLAAVLGIWLFGVGFAMTLSVPYQLITEAEKLIKFLMMPLYIISGVMVPISLVPYPYREWLVLNPLVHAIEAARLGFSGYYHAIPELDLFYLYGVALVLVFFGLVMQIRFAERMIAQ
jgi:capsular polysaccharide transport system permease protein